MNSLNLYKDKIKEIDSKILSLKNERYILNKEYIELKHEECQKHIGRCFLEHGFYSMIIDTDNISFSINGGDFNEYQYKIISFAYPYDNDLMPIFEDKVYFNFNKNLLSGREEVTKEEFMLKFNEVNKQWLEKLSNNI